MARKTNKAIYKNITMKDLIIIVNKARICYELKNNPPVLKSITNNNWFWIF